MSPILKFQGTSIARRVGLLFLSLLVAAIVVAPAQPASAYMRFHATTTVNLRSGPGTTYPVVQTIGYGTPVDINCQVQGGTSVEGNATWDQLTGGQWVTDQYVSTSSYNSYHPGLPKCSREWRAVAWASARIGSSAYEGWCEYFVEQAYGTSGIYSSALSNYNAQRNAGRIYTSLPAPRGALVFWRIPGDGGYGHVTLSRGGGEYVTTSGPNVRIVTHGFWSGRGGTYLGWSYVPSSWPGRV